MGESIRRVSRPTEPTLAERRARRAVTCLPLTDNDDAAFQRLCCVRRETTKAFFFRGGGTAGVFIGTDRVRPTGVCCNDGPLMLNTGRHVPVCLRWQCNASWESVFFFLLLLLVFILFLFYFLLSLSLLFSVSAASCAAEGEHAHTGISSEVGSISFSSAKKPQN